MVGQRDVLSIASVDRIRFYVKRKYEHLSKEKHAEIVADAIVKIVMRQLPPLTDELKESICQELVKDVIIAKQRPVQLADINRVSTRHTEILKNQDGQQQLLLQQWRIEHGLASPTVTGQCYDQAIGWWGTIVTAIRRHNRAMVYGLGCLAIVGGVLTAQLIQQYEAQRAAHSLTGAALSEIEAAAVQVNTMENTERLLHNELPAHYQFHEVDEKKLKAYLDTRSSLLVEQQYYDAIVAAAKQFNISPVLLFAITGQEQGFVPRGHEQAEEIANNPFNVFHSWQDYNTTIEQSSEIAARTIVNLSKDRPADEEAISWINRKYAEDPNWSKGVTSLFATITSYIND